MIRKFEITDIDTVMNIWLEVNRKVHDFISEDYWSGHYEEVKQILPLASVYVYEEQGEIQGFIGIQDNYIAGIFVKEEMRRKGIGSELLSYVKRIYDHLSLHVYRKNQNAVDFYYRQYFMIQNEKVEEETGETEYLMNWKR